MKTFFDALKKNKDEYDFRDFAALELKQPISKKKWLNEAILRFRDEQGLSNKTFDLEKKEEQKEAEFKFLDEVNELKPIYLGASPFPHIVLNDFLPKQMVLGVEEELMNSPDEIWDKSDEHYHQVKKRGISENVRMPPKARQIMEYLNSDEVITFLEKLTGIKGLMPDPYNQGGGVHQTLRGGRLGVHTDFNTHPITGYYRRVNIIFYVNEEWQPIWGGGLELWDKTASNRIKMINPGFNKAAIFTASEISYHGHPEPLNCPSDKSRLSFAVYYYTKEAPEADLDNRFHANWA